jgi:hypothetical protein
MREHNLDTLMIQSQHYLQERLAERTRDRIADETRAHAVAEPRAAALEKRRGWLLASAATLEVDST